MRVTNQSNHVYTHSATACASHYTYVHGLCWYVSAERRRTRWHVQVGTKWLSDLFSYLSAWSLGQSTRVAVTLTFKNQNYNMSCVGTDDFDFIPYKIWSVVSTCKSRYSLVQRAILTYSNVCEGKCSIIQMRPSLLCKMFDFNQCISTSTLG